MKCKQDSGWNHSILWRGYEVTNKLRIPAAFMLAAMIDFHPCVNCHLELRVPRSSASYYPHEMNKLDDHIRAMAKGEG